MTELLFLLVPQLTLLLLLLLLLLLMHKLSMMLVDDEWRPMLDIDIDLFKMDCFLLSIFGC